MVHRILVASYTSEVTTLVFDPAAKPARFEIVGSASVGQNPAWVTPHPTAPSIYFSSNELEAGEIRALQLDEQGGAKELGLQQTSGEHPCHTAVVGNEILAANYSSGSLAILPVSDSPPYIHPAHAYSPLQFEGSGPQHDRQAGPHAHHVLPVPSHNEVLAVDLGSDKAWRLQRSTEDNQWHIKGAVEYKPGSGPRHVVFYENTLYTVLELTNGVAVHTLPKLPAPAVHLQTLDTLASPPELKPGDKPMLAAEIILTPPSASFPEAYLYVSNRNDPSPQGDTVAIYEINRDDHQLKYITEVRTGLTHVRHITASPFDEGRYIVMGGVESNGAKVFERVDGGKNLREIASLPSVAKPTGFVWL